MLSKGRPVVRFIPEVLDEVGAETARVRLALLSIAGRADSGHRIRVLCCHTRRLPGSVFLLSAVCAWTHAASAPTRLNLSRRNQVRGCGSFTRSSSAIVDWLSFASNPSRTIQLNPCNTQHSNTTQTQYIGSEQNDSLPTHRSHLCRPTNSSAPHACSHPTRSHQFVSPACEAT